MIPLLLALQASSPWTTLPAEVTIGDTVHLIRRIATTADARPRLEPLTGGDVVQPLSDPHAGYAEGDLVVRYIVTAFEPGRQTVPMPDLELMFADGRTQVVFGDTAWILVSSVLPVDSMRPRSALGPVALTRRSLRPLLAMMGTALAATIAWAVFRRRRRWVNGVLPVSDGAMPPIDKWIAAGEGRAVATQVSDRLRGAIAGLEPLARRDLDTSACIAVLRVSGDLPARELAEVLRALDRARFAPAVPADVTEVVDRAERLLTELARRSTEGAA